MGERERFALIPKALLVLVPLAIPCLVARESLRAEPPLTGAVQPAEPLDLLQLDSPFIRIGSSGNNDLDPGLSSRQRKDSVTQESLQNNPGTLVRTTEANESSQQSSLQQLESHYFTGYDSGIFVRPKYPQASPYSLKINSQNTFRYTVFERDKTSWVDSAGNTNGTFDSSGFGIPRGRLIFTGMALKPEISYLLNFDYNTVTTNPIGFRAYVLSYRFNRSLELHVGQNKVPGSREWLHSSFDSQEGPDRSMATTFFRPSLSQGVWATGEPVDGLHYHAMLANGFNTLNVIQSNLNQRLCGSSSVWWEPWGSFGRGYSDLEVHCEPVVRVGGSFTSTVNEGNQASDYPENTSIRLSDGTLVTQQGALSPGVTVQAFDLSLAAIDLAFKVQGLSLSMELYLQRLGSLQGSGPLPVSSLNSYGGVAQGGYFILSQKFEVYTRNSLVTGTFGSGSEYGVGANWFPLTGKSSLRYTFDGAWLDSSPADQNRTGFVAGQSGFLLRTQITSFF